MAALLHRWTLDLQGCSLTPSSPSVLRIPCANHTQTVNRLNLLKRTLDLCSIRHQIGNLSSSRRLILFHLWEKYWWSLMASILRTPWTPTHLNNSTWYAILYPHAARRRHSCPTRQLKLRWEDHTPMESQSHLTPICTSYHAKMQTATRT